MKVKILSWGNSAAIRLNKTILNQLGAKVGDSLKVEINNGSLILRPVAPVYTMDDLLAGCTEENMHQSDEDREWLEAPPVGREFK